MNCQQLLTSYTEYRDGLLDAESAAEVEAHLSACPSCRRYERVVDEGVRRLRDLPPVKAGEDFIPRLKHRIYHLEDGDLGSGDSRGSGVTALAAVGLTILMAAAAWSPVLRQAGATVELPPLVVSGPPTTGDVRSEPQLPQSAFFRASETRTSTLSTVSAASRQRAPALLGSALLSQSSAPRFELLRTSPPSTSAGADGIGFETPGPE